MECVKCQAEPNDSDAANYYSEAASCIKNVSTNRFLEYAKIAVSKFCHAARLSQAAALAKQVAELMEEEHDYEEAFKFYE